MIGELSSLNIEGCHGAPLPLLSIGNDLAACLFENVGRTPLVHIIEWARHCTPRTNRTLGTHATTSRLDKALPSGPRSPSWNISGFSSFSQARFRRILF